MKNKARTAWSLKTPDGAGFDGVTLTPLSRKIAFIVNPHSANGTTGKAWPSLSAKARERLGPCTTYVTTAPGEAEGLTQSAVKAGAEVVVCVGGDGTLNEVVNGLMTQRDPPGADTLLGVIPCGTGCDFSRSAALPRDPEAALETIGGQRHRSMDVGLLTYRDSSGQLTRRYFINITSFGLGGEVDERVNRTSKVFGGFLSFIWATLISILTYEKKRVRLRVDDHFDEEVTCLNVAVANGQYHGGGMWVAPDALLDDGLFDVTVIGNLNLSEVFWHLPKLYSGRISRMRKVTMLSGRHVEADSDQKVLLDMDGEQPGALPVTLDVVPSALRLICG
jgi:diacylglycerol kinase (ATP)